MGLVSVWGAFEDFGGWGWESGWCGRGCWDGDGGLMNFCFGTGDGGRHGDIRLHLERNLICNYLSIFQQNSIFHWGYKLVLTPLPPVPISTQESLNSYDRSALEKKRRS